MLSREVSKTLGEWESKPARTITERLRFKTSKDHLHFKCYSLINDATEVDKTSFYKEVQTRRKSVQEKCTPPNGKLQH